MSSGTIDVLTVRRGLGRKEWQAPVQFGPDGWGLVRYDGRASVLISMAEFDGTTWIHASVAGVDETPTYHDLVLLHEAVFRGGYAYQVFAPPADHVNIHEHALHLWGRADGRPALPEFGCWGSI